MTKIFVQYHIMITTTVTCEKCKSSEYIDKRDKQHAASAFINVIFPMYFTNYSRSNHNMILDKYFCHFYVCRPNCNIL